MSKHKNNNGDKPEEEIMSDEELMKLLAHIDWSAHWQKVIGVVSDQASAYERARAKSMEGAAQKDFL